MIWLGSEVGRERGIVFRDSTLEQEDAMLLMLSVLAVRLWSVDSFFVCGCCLGGVDFLLLFLV